MLLLFEILEKRWFIKYYQIFSLIFERSRLLWLLNLQDITVEAGCLEINVR